MVIEERIRWLQVHDGKSYISREFIYGAIAAARA